MSKDLIFEIGSEEIPAAFVPRSLETIKENLTRAFDDARLGYKSVRTLGTPRRLTLIVEGLEERQPDRTEEVRGPQTRAAYDKDGNPTKALSGFARGQGVELGDIKVVKTEKGEYVYVVKEIKGNDTIEILPEILASVTARDYFPKSMRWGSYDVTFARPVHWILAVYGGAVVPFTFGHVKSGNTTRGHRFLSSGAVAPASVEVRDVDSYTTGLEENFVIADPERRKAIILEGLEKGAAGAGGVLLPDEGLVTEVTYLVEYPVVVVGSFEEEFLELPREVVVNAMREHQRYFSIVDGSGALLPRFMTVANTRAVDMDTVRKGNERVLRARLNDAKFYYDSDIRVPLTERAKELKGVIFQAKLGTSFEKVERFTSLALHIGEKVGFSAAPDRDETPSDYLTESFNPAQFDSKDTDPGLYSKFVLGRSAVLAKADLVSGIVGEFPTLQGVMGSVYASRGGEVPEVAAAIYEHYLPSSAGGELPASVPGAIVSIADKMDTICGCFGIGLKPTGAADPYALRRSALGIISIIRDKSFEVPIDEIVARSVEILGDKLTVDAGEVRSNVLDFFKERLRNMLLAQDLAFDSIDAVLSAPWFDLVDAVSRIRALESFKGHPACTTLVTAFKRVSNILKGVEPGRSPDEALLADPAEKALYEVVYRLAPEIERYSAEKAYEKLFTELASIKDTIDRFFDDVMVMVDDEKVKRNRLALLSAVRDLYFKTADLSKLAV